MVKILNIVHKLPDLFFSRAVELYGCTFHYRPGDGEEGAVYRYGTIDRDGGVYIHVQSPDKDMTARSWKPRRTREGILYLGYVTFEGDWQDSLVEVPLCPI